MRAQSTGSTALLMFIFLGVIAVVGVFGIPQFAPVVASPSLRADGWTSDEFSPLQHAGVNGAFTQGAADLFASIETDSGAALNDEDNPFPPIDHERLERQAQAGNRLAGSRDASTELPGEALDGWTLQSKHGGSSFAEPGSKRIIRPGRRRSSASLDDRPPAKLKLLAFGEPSAASDDSAQSIPRSFGAAASPPTGNGEAVRQDENQNALVASQTWSDGLGATAGLSSSAENTEDTAGQASSGTRQTKNDRALARAEDDSAQPLELPSAPRKAADRTTRSGGGVSKATNRQEPELLTWRAAVGRLNSLGIRHFRLSPGERPREFHFSCFFTPADNPRITHRFEAEAKEPLEAVKKVLAQIDDWLAKR